MRVPTCVADLVEYQCEFNSMVVRVDGEESEAFQVEQGVSQECILSPQLFNIYDEHIIREVLEHCIGSISIGGRRVSVVCNMQMIPSRLFRMKKKCRSSSIRRA